MAVSDLLDTGTLEHVSSVAKRVTGNRPGPSTIWRWCVKGLRGGRIKLDCAFHAGCWCTTEAAFREFIAAQTEFQRAHPPGREAADVDDATLAAAGLL